MRITGGIYRSRIIQAPEGETTRPTADKIKEALFSSIGSYIHGGNALDLFAGSGGIGLEAISRGAEHAYFCDNDKKAIQTIKSNRDALKLKSACTIFNGDYKAALEKWNRHQFTFIYLDPPYALVESYEAIATYISEHNMLLENGWLIMESTLEETFSERYGHLKKVKEKTYKTCRLTYYKED